MFSKLKIGVQLGTMTYMTSKSTLLCFSTKHTRLSKIHTRWSCDMVMRPYTLYSMPNIAYVYHIIHTICYNMWYATNHGITALAVANEEDPHK